MNHMEIHHSDATVTVVIRTDTGMNVTTFEELPQMVEHFIENCEYPWVDGKEQIEWLNTLRLIITSTIAKAKRIAKSKTRRDKATKAAWPEPLPEIQLLNPMEPKKCHE